MSSDTARARRRVLVVEDEWIIAAEVEDLLGEASYEVVGPAANVSAALTLVASQVIDIAILDVCLGKEMSFPIAIALAARKIPFLFVSGFCSADLPAAFQTFPHLMKPVRSDVLLASVATHLSLRTWCD